MQISITLSQAELDEMSVTKSELRERVILQLDDATLPHGRAAIELCGYDVAIKIVG